MDDEPKWDNEFTRALVALLDLYVGEMKRRSETDDLVPPEGYEVMAAEVKDHGLVIVARGATAAKVRSVLSEQRIMFPQTMSSEQAEALREPQR